ncbi:MAG: nucleotidyltransferase domain-containing protein [Rhodococcus sp. (in: high G+C Gram-positive bacteria)]
MQLNKPFATVTPTLDGDVLAVLASANTTFTISQIQRILTTASGEGIRKVVNRLAAQGVVLQDEVGRTHTYRLNTEHLAAEPIRALARLHSTFLNRFEQHLDRWGTTLRYAAVFGSAATGHMTLGSDIDVLLIRETDSYDDAWEQRVTELARLITAWTGNDGRIVEFTEHEFHAAAADAEPLLDDVSNQGRTVAGTRAWFTAQLRTAKRS